MSRCLYLFIAFWKKRKHLLLQVDKKVPRKNHVELNEVFLVKLIHKQKLVPIKLLKKKKKESIF